MRNRKPVIHKVITPWKHIIEEIAGNDEIPMWSLKLNQMVYSIPHTYFIIPCNLLIIYFHGVITLWLAIIQIIFDVSFHIQLVFDKDLKYFISVMMFFLVLRLKLYWYFHRWGRHRKRHQQRQPPEPIDYRTGLISRSHLRSPSGLIRWWMNSPISFRLNFNKDLMKAIFLHLLVVI